MLELRYCIKCQELLLTYGMIAHDLYYELVEEFVIYGVIDMDVSSKATALNLLPIMEFLEKKGYIVTCDSSDDHIKIKPLGITFSLEDELEVYRICFNLEH